MAQAILASLLASAIAATLIGRLSIRDVSQGRCLAPCIFTNRMTASAPAQNRDRIYRSPALVMLPSLSRPPLEFCLGTSPIQAAKSRPQRKDFGSATLAT